MLGSCPAAVALRAAAQVPSPRSSRGWPSAPRRRDPGEVGPLSGWSPVARRSGRRPGRSLPVRLVRSAVGMSVQPVERTSSVHVSGVQASRVQASGASRCPDGQASGVRGAAPSAPRWTPEWLGVAGRPGRAQLVDVPPWAAGGVVACLHRAGREGDGSALAVAGSHEVDRSQGRRVAGVRLRRRLGPSGPTRALVQGQGAGRVSGEHGTEQVLTGPGRASWAGRWRGADHGLDREVMTTLRGRWARMVPSRPTPEDPPGSVGEQPAAAPRPQGVRSAVR